MAAIAGHLMEKGEARGLEISMIFEAHDVSHEHLEAQFGIIPLSLTEKLR
jgi:hypothetical protein